MERPRRLLAATSVGAGYGVVTSLLNDASSAYGHLGAPVAGTAAQSVLRVLSTMAGAGWAWAGLAVAIGWYQGTRRAGAAAGALALPAATVTYYASDALLRAEPVLASDIWLWCAAGVLLGALLGAVGASARRPGPLGLPAALTVPVGAAVQMVVLPPGMGGAQVAPEAVAARWLVWALAAAAGVWIVAHHRRRGGQAGLPAGSSTGATREVTGPKA